MFCFQLLLSDSWLRRYTKGRCLVLTTHSMEECEALCHRVGIMVAGRFKAVGPVQRLKSAYGEGYTLDLRVPDSPAPAGARVHHGRTGGDGGGGGGGGDTRAAVGSGRYCSPRHPTHFEPSSHESISTL